MKFKFLSGDVNWEVYGGTFVSKKLNNGEFDYWLIMEVMNWEEVGCETDDGLYYVSLAAVAPSLLPKEKIEDALNCSEVDMKYLKPEHRTAILLESVYEYMGGAKVWQKSGNNLKELMREARKEADVCECLFGFYMDRCQNQIGATGWDVLAGNWLGVLTKEA